MGACTTCGRNAGLMANECNDCRTRRLAHEQDRAIEEQRRTALAALAEREDWARDQAAELDERVNRAGRSTLLATADVPVDSIVNDEVMSAGFDVEEVRDYLFDGWTIVGTIPKTLGIGLTNVSIGASSGQTWGAGLGGNVIGVYVLLAYELTRENLDASRDIISEYYLELSQTMA